VAGTAGDLQNRSVRIRAAATALTVIGVATALAAGCGPAAKKKARGAAPASVAEVVQSPEAGPPASPAGSPAPTPSGSAAAGGACAMLPPDSGLRAEVTGLPVHPRSATYVASIGAGSHAHADFGAGLYEGRPFGIPITTVPAGTAGSAVSFDYAAESDRGPYPIPADPLVEGGPNADGDRHILLFDPRACKAYELFDAHRAGGGWHAGSGAVFDLRSNRLRTAGYTSADAAGLPIMPLLVRYEEVAAGRIDHAIRITVPRSQSTYVWPARHAAGRGDASLPPMGLRIRLKSSVDTSRFPAQARVIAEAMKRYGVIVADNGSAWYVSGTQDNRWNNDQLRALSTLTGANFEAVDASGLMADPNSGARR
jgi:hypothetical protein